MALIGCGMDSGGVKRRLDESAASFDTSLETRVMSDFQKQATLDHLPQSGGITLQSHTIYMSGHGEAMGGGRTLYLTADCHDSTNKPHGLIGEEIKNRLPPTQVSRVFITDFCYAGNFFGLRYSLEISGGKATWTKTVEWSILESEGFDCIEVADCLEDAECVETPEEMEGYQWVEEWVEVVAVTASRTVHFSSCTSSERVWEDNVGGYFTQSMLRTWTEEHSLPARLQVLRDNVESKLREKKHRDQRQTPQIFSDTKLDLDEKFSLAKLVLGLGPN